MTARLPANAAPSCPRGADGAREPCVFVVVVSENGASRETKTVTSEMLAGAEDVDNHHVGSDCAYVCGSYDTRVVPYGPTMNDPGLVTGTSIDALAGLAQADPRSVTYASIVGSSNGTTTLAKRLDSNDFADPRDPATGNSPFVDRLVPVFFHPGVDSEIAYVRPLKNESDTNVADYVLSAEGGSVTVTLYESGKPLAPTVVASKPTARGDVSFTGATGDGATTDRASDWTWHFGDGVVKYHQPATVSHTYAPGSWNAYAAVAEPDQSSGTSMYVTVVIPSTKPSTSGSDSPSPTRSRSSPPVQRTSNSGVGAPTNPRQGPVSGHGNQLGGAATAPTLGAVAGAATGAASGAPASASATRSPKRLSPGVVTVGADNVVGYLLAGAPNVATGPTSAEVSSRPPAAPAARRAGPSPDTSPSRWVLGVAGILVLLVLGAAGEYRRPSRAPKRRA